MDKEKAVIFNYCSGKRRQRGELVAVSLESVSPNRLAFGGPWRKQEVVMRENTNFIVVLFEKGFELVVFV